jgi:hypothetical protein
MEDMYGIFMQGVETLRQELEAQMIDHSALRAPVHKKIRQLLIYAREPLDVISYKLWEESNRDVV